MARAANRRPRTNLEWSMKFSKTSLADAMVIDMQRNEDARGFFARTFCDA